MVILINLNDARKKLNELEGSAEYNKGVTDAFNALFDLPTIEAETVKHGYWRFIGATTRGAAIINRYSCSECGYEADTTDYCPNCGARMDEVEE